jgi:hypothetical protein
MTNRSPVFYSASGWHIQHGGRVMILLRNAARENAAFTKEWTVCDTMFLCAAVVAIHSVQRQGVGHGLRNPHLGIGGWRLVIGEWQP